MSEARQKLSGFWMVSFFPFMYGIECLAVYGFRIAWPFFIGGFVIVLIDVIFGRTKASGPA